VRKGLLRWSESSQEMRHTETIRVSNWKDQKKLKNSLQKFRGVGAKSGVMDENASNGFEKRGLQKPQEGS